MKKLFLTLMLLIFALPAYAQQQIVILCKEKAVSILELQPVHVKPFIPDTGKEVIQSFFKVGEGETKGWFYYHCVVPDNQWDKIKAWADKEIGVSYWVGNDCFSQMKEAAEISVNPDIYSDAERVLNTEITVGEETRIVKAKVAKKDYGATIDKKKLIIPHQYFMVGVE